MKDIFHKAYRVLFNIEVDLEGCTQDLNEQLRLVPDLDTVGQLVRYKMLSRKQKNSNVLLINVEPEGVDKGKPNVVPVLNEVFRFQLKFRDKQFIDRTHLAAYDWGTQVAVVTNEVNHVEGPDLLLTAPIPNYNSANDYKPGFIVKSGTSFFKALQESNSGDPHGTGETGFWKNIAAGDGLSQADLLARNTLSKPVDLDTIAVLEIKNSAAVSSAYRLFDGSMKCNEVTYKIKFYKQN